MTTTASDEAIFRSLYAGLRRFAAVTASGGIEPDDLLQDALAATLRHHRLGELDNPGAYLRRTMVNLASNQRRRAFNRRKAIAALGASLDDRSPSYPSDLADLEWLSPRQRAVLFLSEIEGYRFSEIADMLSCTEGNARMIASRARRQLRDALAGGT